MGQKLVPELLNLVRNGWGPGSEKEDLGSPQGLDKPGEEKERGLCQRL